MQLAYECCTAHLSCRCRRCARQAGCQGFKQQSQASSWKVLCHLDLASHKQALAGDPVAVCQPCMMHADAKLQCMAQVGVLQHRQESRRQGMTQSWC